MRIKGYSRAYNRKASIRKALRKKHLAEDLGLITYDNLHQYSKNKVHCSCPSCNPKTNAKGKSNLTHSDAKKMLDMDLQEKELTFAP